VNGVDPEVNLDTVGLINEKNYYYIIKSKEYKIQGLKICGMQ
jgi:hypothetical protein